MLDEKLWVYVDLNSHFLLQTSCNQESYLFKGKDSLYDNRWIRTVKAVQRNFYFLIFFFCFFCSLHLYVVTFIVVDVSFILVDGVYEWKMSFLEALFRMRSNKEQKWLVENKQYLEVTMLVFSK
jgi:hypothetical protein